MLRDFGLTYQVQDEVLLITSEEGALANALVGVYDLSPILGPDGAAQDAVYSITSALDRRGIPQVKYEPMGKSLLVRDTEEGHEKLQQLLHDLALVHQAAQPAEPAEPAEPAAPTPDLDPLEAPEPMPEPESPAKPEPTPRSDPSDPPGA
jgi:outer membrane biosynthesis protein TonB